MVEKPTTERATIIAGAVFDAGKSVKLLGAGNTRSDETLEQTEVVVLIIKEVANQMTSALNDITRALQILADSVEKSK